MISSDKQQHEKSNETSKTKTETRAQCEANMVERSPSTLKIQAIVEAVGFVLFPSRALVDSVVRSLIDQFSLLDSFREKFASENQRLELSSASDRYACVCEETLNATLDWLIATAAKVAHTDSSSSSSSNQQRTLLTRDELHKRLGIAYFERLCDEFENELKSIGSDMAAFYNNLNGFHDLLIDQSKFGARFAYSSVSLVGYVPLFKCETSADTSVLHIYSVQHELTSFVRHFYSGLIESSTRRLWSLGSARVSPIDNDEFDSLQLGKTALSSEHFLGYRVELDDATLASALAPLSCGGGGGATTELRSLDDSREASALCVGVDDFKAIFPFTIIIDRSMCIRELGEGLIHQLSHLVKDQHADDLHFDSFFEIIKPKLNAYTFQSMLLNSNMSFLIRTRCELMCENSETASNTDAVVQQHQQVKELILKGSVVHVPESDCLLFIGSPFLQHLDDLTRCGLFMSDIPIHDATRDIILIHEQTKAQEGLKIRMEKLKKSIETTHNEIEVEKQTNIDLLNMIFPQDIAKMLWRGEKVQARRVVDVTLLYSDIVGFTAICSVAQPIEIIEMLKRLYTHFDNYCGLLDVYKIETIGDAYIAAGGLHKPSATHAQQMALMSLLMMQSSANNIDHRGEKIRMRIGIHTGEVLAGIVGLTTPRYCLFGNNCTIANKFESMSEEKRVHVSPITKNLLDDTPGFECETRAGNTLPENFVCSDEKIKRVSYFLNSYKNARVGENEPLIDHVKAALVDLNIS